MAGQQSSQDAVLALLRTWMHRARIGQHSHHEAGKFFRRMHYALAIPTVVITTALGTAAFSSITSNVSREAKIIFGVFSIAAAILAALQLQFRFAERSEKHRGIGSNYGTIRRRIELVLANPPSSRNDLERVMDEIRGKLDAVGGEGEAVSRRIFERTEKEVGTT